MDSERGLSADLPEEVYDELRKIANQRHVTVTPRLRQLLGVEQPGSPTQEEQPPADFLPPTPPESA